MWFYLSKALAPVDLLLVYPQWHFKTDEFLSWLPLISAIGVTVVLLWQRSSRWGRTLLFAWIFFCVALAPVLGFADVGFMKYSLVADHYQYIALAGVAALAGAGWSICHRRAHAFARTVAKATAAAAVVALMLLAWHQSRLFGDPAALFGATVEGNSDCWMIQNFLGNELAHQGRTQEAIDCNINKRCA